MHYFSKIFFQRFSSFDLWYFVNVLGNRFPKISCHDMLQIVLLWLVSDNSLLDGGSPLSLGILVHVFRLKLLTDVFIKFRVDLSSVLDCAPCSLLLDFWLHRDWSLRDCIVVYYHLLFEFVGGHTGLCDEIVYVLFLALLRDFTKGVETWLCSRHGTMFDDTTSTCGCWLMINLVGIWAFHANTRYHPGFSLDLSSLSL